MKALLSWPNLLLKAHLLLLSPWRLGFQHTNFGGTQTFRTEFSAPGPLKVMSYFHAKYVHLISIALKFLTHSRTKSLKSTFLSTNHLNQIWVRLNIWFIQRQIIFCQPVKSNICASKIQWWDRQRIDIHILNGRNRKEETGPELFCKPRRQILLYLKSWELSPLLILCPPDPLGWRSYLLDILEQGSSLLETLCQRSCPCSFAGQRLSSKVSVWLWPLAVGGLIPVVALCWVTCLWLSSARVRCLFCWRVMGIALSLQFPWALLSAATRSSLVLWWEGESWWFLNCLPDHSSIVLDNRSWLLFRWLTNLPVTWSFDPILPILSWIGSFILFHMSRLRMFQSFKFCFSFD